MTSSSKIRNSEGWPRTDPQSMPALVTAAVAIGRIPGEPDAVLAPARSFGLIVRLFGLKRRRPLSDPRLEAVRAISAALTRGATPIRDDLIGAARRAGWTIAELQRTFPAAALQEPTP